jgi:hypothetical protein
MKKFILLLSISASIIVHAQKPDSTISTYQSSAESMMSLDRKLTIGGYAQVDYNQRIGEDVFNTGVLDVHRVVLLFGYKFNSRTQFITEVEFEHVKEVYIEQAFLDYKINDFIHFRGGLLLIPMGIINEYHEPTTFHGVERPLIDKYIAPTTWREIGAGFTGNIPTAALKYQVYVVNGFKSFGYDDDGNPEYYLNGKNGLRKGRQKGAESFISSPNLSAKVDYYGLPGLSLGLSGYFGNTQSLAYNGLDKNDANAIKSADSTVVGVSMVGADARYQIQGIELRGQLYYTSLSNTEQYNAAAGNGPDNHLGSTLTGYYIEAGYNVFQKVNRVKTALIPFLRYEAYNTQHQLAENVDPNKAYDNTIITTGLTWKITPGAALKADLQFIESADNTYKKYFNAGVGIMF